MKLLGFEITRTRKQYPPVTYYPGDRYAGGWYPIVQEPYTGAWQRNDELYRPDSVLSNVIVFRCISVISGDISKMRIRLVQQDDGIWNEVDRESPFWPVLRKPNSYQNRIQFFENWMNSKLTWGNTYALKGRDNRGIVTALYILDPCHVRPLVAPDGEVLYELREDYLSGTAPLTTVPQSEIIHDRWNCLFHPLCGLSPIYAAGLPAIMSQRIQTHSDRFFHNGANPGGMLVAPGEITKDQKKVLKEEFAQGYSGQNVGKLFVASHGLKYEPFKVNAVDAQLIEQLKWSGETIATAFGVPGYKVGVGPLPSYNNIEALERQYYNDCLQNPIESIELCLDEGLALPSPLGTEFDLDDLLRMDTATMVDSIGKAVGSGVMAPNEGRHKLNLEPVAGGDTPYLQNQNWSLAALDKREQQQFTAPPPPPTLPSADGTRPPAPAADEEASPADGERILRDAIAGLELARIECRAD